MDNRHRSGQIEFSVSSEETIMTNRKSGRKGCAELRPNGKDIGRMLNANYRSLIDNGFRIH